jgi:hypothetical protein
MHASHSNPDAAEASRIRKIDAALAAAIARDPEGFAAAGEWVSEWRDGRRLSDAEIVEAAERTLSPPDLETFRRVRAILVEELLRHGLRDSAPPAPQDP